MEKFWTGMAALLAAAGLTAVAAAQNPFDPRTQRQEREERERRLEVHRNDIVGRIEKVRVERDGDVRLWVRRTDYSGRRLEGRGLDREVEIKAHETHCWIFHDRGMREVNVKASEGK